MAEDIPDAYAVELVGAGKRFGDVQAIHDVSMAVRRGEICVLIGPSGCGKTTTLKMINRVTPADTGVVRVRGRDIREVDEVKLRRSIGYVIQQVGLFPHMTIAENVGLPLRLEGKPRRIRRERAAELLSLVGLSDELLDRRPEQLSGGQQQRIGVARALAADPDIILMDEPFGAVDPLLRPQLQDELRGIQKRLGKTIVLVTHDLSEAFALADTLVLMDRGRVVQKGRPRDFLLAPDDPFVGRFLQQVGASEALRVTRVADLPRGPADMPGPALGVDRDATIADLLQLLGAASPAPARIDIASSADGPVSITSVFGAIASAMRREARP